MSNDDLIQKASEALGALVPYGKLKMTPEEIINASAFNRTHQLPVFEVVPFKESDKWTVIDSFLSIHKDAYGDITQQFLTDMVRMQLLEDLHDTVFEGVPSRKGSNGFTGLREMWPAAWPKTIYIADHIRVRALADNELNKDSGAAFGWVFTTQIARSI